ncbi:hypothetical protein BD289DRAFT_362147, partial [Coniella lustricola]
RTQNIHILDVGYQSALHRTDIVFKDEEARRLKLRVVVLRDEAASLRDQLADKSAEIIRISQQYDDLRVELDRLSQTCLAQEAQLRSQARQQSELKAELLSASNMSENSAKILTEKLALSREVAVLRPELDHLRSQVAHQKDVLAQKLALERQLSTLEIELANEKRIAQTTIQTRDSQSTKHEKELQSRVSDLERQLEAAMRLSEKSKSAQNQAQSGTEQKLQQKVTELERTLATEKKASEQAKKTQKKLKGKVKQLEENLATERREAERAKKTSEKDAAASRDHIEMLTQRLEEFKTKLRETRAELKELRTSMTRAQTTTTTVPIRTDDEPKKPLSRVKGATKRRANEVTVDEMMLDSPDHEEGKAKRVAQGKKKRGAYDLTTVGEKSTFSITPFLEKSNTISLSETIEEVEEPSVLDGKGNAAVPIVEPEAEEEGDIPVSNKQPTKSVAKALKATKSKPTAAEQKKARGKLKAHVLAEITPNIPIAANATSFDDNVDEAMQKPGTKASSAATQSTDTSNTGLSMPEPKKKKRKILGAGNKGTIFDNDEDAGDLNAGLSTIASAATKRKPAGIKGAGRKGPIAALSRGAFPRKSFSPLKKDRRGVGASFLV